MGAIKPWHVILLIVFVILPLLVIAAVIALVLVLVRRSRPGTEPASGTAPQSSGTWQQGSPSPLPAPAPEDPRTILDRRLALGEIDPEEHARLRRILETENGRTP